MLRSEINLDDIDRPSLICDNSGKVIKVNSSIKDIVSEKLLIDANISDIFIDIKLNDYSSFIMKDSRIVDFKSDYLVVLVVKISDEQNFVVSYPNNATELTESIYKKANFDPLTNLPNRSQMINRFNVLLESAIRSSNLLGVFFIDLDNFKFINDTFGHKVGDKYLCATGNILNESIRLTDSICRWGGDEFLMICTNFTSNQYIEDMCKRIVNNINDKINEKNGFECTLDVSVGVSIFPDHSKDIDELIDMADKAMYKAKQINGSTYVILQ